MNDGVFASLLNINPGVFVMAAGLLALLARGTLQRGIVLIGGPVVALLALLARPGDAEAVTSTLFGYELVLYHVDSLNRVFGLAFLIAAGLAGIYSLHREDRIQDASAMVYAGAAIAAAFVGDFLSLFVFWELTAVASVFLIFARGTKAAYAAGMRYLAIQVLSGVMLLGGAALYGSHTGSMLLPEFNPKEAITALDLNDPGVMLIFIAFGIKAAFPLLHNWLQDSYPNATETGSVVLSAFTTKLAVYALARCFAGTDSLIYIGAIMTVFPVFFAVIENDLRKVLAYSLNNQVGFMVCAVGVGTELAINGAAAHAFAHIMYKALLFMSMGAVMLRVGTTKATELGGLYRTMPLTTVFCLIGAASISAFPLFSGFVAKSLTMSAIGYEHLTLVWAMLLFASAGVLEHSGIKIPYFAFFSHDSGKRPQEAPFNMLIAMGGAAALCIIVGVAPAWLYTLLPYREKAMEYLANDLWTVDHVLTQMQLLVLAAFAFVLLKRLGLYPAEKRGVVLDFDWTYRKLGYGFALWTGRVWTRLGPAITEIWRGLAARIFRQLTAAFSPEGELSRGALSGSMAVWTAIVLGLVLVVTAVFPT
ncbi:MAG: Na(+)/H(+) antiporter subunit D [Pseudomonadota bacterium]